MTDRVLLFNPRSSPSGKPILPLALLALAARLDVPWVLIDGNLVDDPTTALQALAREAHVLAITVMPGPQLQQAYRVSKALKASHPSLRIVWGGYFPTQHWNITASSHVVDVAVRGHGDLLFGALLDALRTGSPLDEISGLAWKKDASVATTGVAPVPHPAQARPLPLQQIDAERYIRNTFLGSRTLGHHSSYGCPFFCNFCAVVNMDSGKWRALDATTLIDDVREYRTKYQVNAVEFYDNNFFVHERRTVEFAEGIRGLGMQWWGEGRVDRLLGYSDASLAACRASGLRMVFLGAESGSAETLARMDKGGTLRPEHTLELAARLRDFDIIPEFSFVLGNPPDPEADVSHTLDFVRRVKAIHPAAEIILYLYTPEPVPGGLSDAARTAGFAYPSSLEAWLDAEQDGFSQRRSRLLPWINQDLRRRVRDFERVLNAYYPTRTDQRLTRVRRTLLRGASAWRWRLRRYEYPFELRALQRVMRYQRPETTGF